MVSVVSSPNTFNLAQVRTAIRELQPQLVDWRRHLHQYPELGFQEQKTAAFIAKKLQTWGIDHQTEVAQTGIVATIESGQPGPVVGIRADIDALPIKELNDLSYISRHDGIMHACGHDGHTAIALGLAYYLVKNRDQWSGTVKIIFQPAEEGPGGAKPMIEAGVLKNPDVEGMFGLHLWNNLPLGTVGVRSGALMAAVQSFWCTLLGKGGHGALPHQTVDAIVLGSQIVNALQTVVSRNVSPLDSAVVTVGEFKAGTRHNVIAGTARLSGTVRYFNPDLKDVLPQRIEAIIAGICQSQGATYDLDSVPLYPPVMNDERMAAIVRDAAFAVVETPAGVVPECQTMAAEDMSFFLEAVPGCYFFLGTSNPDRGLDFPHHHPRFNFDESALCVGVELFVRCINQFAQRSRS